MHVRCFAYEYYLNHWKANCLEIPDSWLKQLTLVQLKREPHSAISLPFFLAPVYLAV